MNISTEPYTVETASLVPWSTFMKTNYRQSRDHMLSNCGAPLVLWEGGTRVDSMEDILILMKYGRKVKYPL
jgi:hypothetical protein